MKIEIDVPYYKSKSDLYFRDYEKFLQVIDENKTEDEIIFDILNIFYNITRKTAKKLQYKQIEFLVKKINDIINCEKSEFKPIITYNKKQYGFIPNFSDITYLELIHLEELYNKKDFIGLTSILYRPIKGRIKKNGEYEIDEYERPDSELFKNITYDVVEGYLELFTRASESLNLYMKSTEKM